ncbi:TM0106 family RecB-like putative nuclease [Marisediminicola sp. LYQ85]|uniref:TM0106 family RecB-like putative nuclease n=1 Tax=Marisediminicola sp. LYQ85 TaxID=3391062 RepID=UPI003983BAF9
MYFLDGSVITSASDLSAASACEFAFARGIDVKLGRIDAVDTAPDEMLARTGALGDVHEQRVLNALREQFGAGVVEIERPDVRDRASLAEAVAQTTAAFAGGADVVFQATFFDGGFVGFADFIVRTADDSYEVQDTKLARSAKVTALLQLAAYWEQLGALGIRRSDTVSVLLGDGSTSAHQIRDILPVYRHRRERLGELIASRIGSGADAGANAGAGAGAGAADLEPVQWGDPRYTACGHCDTCSAEIAAHRDVLLVAGLRLTQRARLNAAGVLTIEQLAERTHPVADMSASTLAALRDQAAVQLESTPDRPAWRVLDRSRLDGLPEPDAGDIFFDFEGDPLHQEGDSARPVWGLDYLFGLVESDETFRAFWAHDLAQERRALIEFLDYVTARRAAHPGMHIYHYAAYERSHLLSLAARHGVGEETVDDLLRNNVLIDLYPVVRQGLRIGSPSYSLKKLEPLYMGSLERQGVANAADSISEYVRYRDLLDAGEADDAATVLADIERYNTYDCISTLRLRDWLRAVARGLGSDAAIATTAAAELPLEVPVREPDPVYLALEALLADIPLADRTADDTALALAAAAIDYHRREAKSFWWEHFTRLSSPVDEWSDTRGVVVIDRIDVERDWFREGRQRQDRRHLRVTGTIAPGSALRAGDSQFFVLYDAPLPPIRPSTTPGARTAHNRTAIVEVLSATSFILEEKLEQGAPPYAELPMAITPAPSPNPGTQASAIAEWGHRVLDAAPVILPDPAMDILRRTAGAADAIIRRPSTVDAIRDTLLGLDRSYLAVQGPPGTGKTYTGSRVIADLVANHGWRVGVVAQSHAAVENMLRGVVKAGLDPARVAKKPKKGDESVEVEWSGSPTALPDGGFVLGGTAWTFSNENTVPRASLDLLVVDEAGQFSLASTIAASVAASRLLLLGDPQQLPQVSQGTHPEPVDESALGWLSAGEDVLPAEYGFFLDTSWRMHPALCSRVSDLSYLGRLTSHASDRRLAGVEPGLHAVPLEHGGNSTSSPEEADAVVARVQSVLGLSWEGGGMSRPLVETDVIVVAPYNAHVELVSARLAAAGLGAVPVGTVDKFQGREAAVAIVSLAASSAHDVPRGLEFLLLANRLNVAISRAQWAAYLIYSPGLTDHLPTNVAGLAQLSAFIRLVEG